MKAPALLATASIGFVAWLLLPLPLFLIAAVVVALVGTMCVAGYWYEQCIRLEAERIQLVFEVEGKSIDLQAMTEDYESTLTRLSEVLDEHSLCPVPVEVTDDQHAAFEKHTGNALEVVREAVVTEASNVTAFPEQRKGSKR